MQAVDEWRLAEWRVCFWSVHLGLLCLLGSFLPILTLCLKKKKGGKTADPDSPTSGYCPRCKEIGCNCISLDSDQTQCTCSTDTTNPGVDTGRKICPHHGRSEESADFSTNSGPNSTDNSPNSGDVTTQPDDEETPEEGHGETGSHVTAEILNELSKDPAMGKPGNETESAASDPKPREIVPDDESMRIKVEKIAGGAEVSEHDPSYDTLKLFKSEWSTVGSCDALQIPSTPKTRENNKLKP